MGVEDAEFAFTSCSQRGRRKYLLPTATNHLKCLVPARSHGEAKANVVNNFTRQ